MEVVVVLVLEAVHLLRCRRRHRRVGFESGRRCLLLLPLHLTLIILLPLHPLLLHLHILLLLLILLRRRRHHHHHHSLLLLFPRRRRRRRRLADLILVATKAVLEWVKAHITSLASSRACRSMSTCSDTTQMSPSTKISLEWSHRCRRCG